MCAAVKSCLKQPVCESEEHLDGENPKQRGVCKPHPLCSRAQTLEGATSSKKGVCKSRCEDDQYLKGLTETDKGTCTIDQNTPNCKGTEVLPQYYAKGSLFMAQPKKACLTVASRISPLMRTITLDDAMEKCAGSEECLGFYCYRSTTTGRISYCYGCNSLGPSTSTSYIGWENLRVPTTPGQCQNCTNAVCADTHYQQGSCSGSSNGLQCLPHPVCKPEEHLVGATKTAKGECTGKRPTCQKGEHLQGADAQNAGKCEKDIECEKSDSKPLYKVPRWNFGERQANLYCRYTGAYKTKLEAIVKCQANDKCHSVLEYATTPASSSWRLCTGTVPTYTTSTYYGLYKKLPKYGSGMQRSLCKACDNTECPEHAYRAGICEGTTNAFTCEAHPTCRADQLLVGGGKTTKGECGGSRPSCKDNEYAKGSSLTKAGECVPDTKCDQPNTYLQKGWGWAAERQKHTCKTIIDGYQSTTDLAKAKLKCKWTQACTALRKYTYPATAAPRYYQCAGIIATTSSYYAILVKLDRAVAPGKCTDCESVTCADDEYREGECKGITNTYTCSKQPVCRASQKLWGATKTKAGVCSSFEPCQSEKQYKSPPTQQGKCLDEPACGTGTYLQKAATWGAQEADYNCATSLPGSYTESDVAQAACDKAGPTCLGTRCYTNPYATSNRCNNCKTFRKYTPPARYKYWIIPKLAKGTAKGSCMTCSNVNCKDTQFRFGTCSGTTNGFTCLEKVKCEKDQYRLPPSTGNPAGSCKLRPECSKFEYLDGGTDEKPGTCTEHPKCQDTAYLEKVLGYVKTEKRQCNEYAKVRYVHMHVDTCLYIYTHTHIPRALKRFNSQFTATNT